MSLTRRAVNDINSEMLYVLKKVPRFKIFFVLFLFISIKTYSSSIACKKNFEEHKINIDYVLFELANSFRNENFKYAVVGGYSIRLHGFNRISSDIDLLIPKTRYSFNKFENILNNLGFTSTTCCMDPEPIEMHANFFDSNISKNRFQNNLTVADQVFNKVKNARFSKDLFIWTFYKTSNPGIVVDVLVTYDLSHFNVVKKELSDHEILTITIEDIIKLKNLSTTLRDKDKKDLEVLAGYLKTK